MTDRYLIDPTHSTIGFSARHLGVSTVRGHFTKFSGWVEGDVADPAGLNGEIDIEIASIHTGTAQRDGHLTSPDFFDAPNWPTMKFVVSGAERLQGDNYLVRGQLTIRETTLPVALEASVEGPIVPDPFGGRARVAVSATGQVNRMDFGLNWDGIAGAIPIASHVIKLDLDVALVLPAEAAAEPAEAAARA